MIEMATCTLMSAIASRCARAPTSVSSFDANRPHRVAAVRRATCRRFCLCDILRAGLPYPDGAVHAEVGGVYVRAAYRGRGHASRLVEAVLSEVRAAGVRGTFLRPSPRSKPLYARLGFTEDGRSLMRLSSAGSNR